MVLTVAGAVCVIGVAMAVDPVLAGSRRASNSRSAPPVISPGGVGSSGADGAGATAGASTSAASADGGMSGTVVGAAGALRGGPAVTPAHPPAYTYYVDCVSGSDSGSGSVGRPWRSLARVGATTFRANTGLYLARGCTWNETLEVNTSSTGSAGVEVTAYGTGAAPVISAAGLRAPSAVSLLGAKVTLSDVVVTGAAQYGVQMFGAADALRNVTITRSGIGVRALGAGAVVDHVAVSDLHMVVDTPGGNDDYGAVGFDVETSNVQITNSSCTNCRAPSYDYGFDGGFVEIWNHGDNLVVSGSTASNTDGFLEVGGDSQGGTSARHVRIVQNTMTEVHGGFFVHGSGEFTIATEDILISGNRITNKAAATNGVFAGDLHSVEIMNNVIVANQPVTFAVPARHSGNTFYLQHASELGFPLGAGETMHPLSAAAW